MDYKTAIRRQRLCITSFLMLVLWGFNALRSHVEKIKDNPETGLLILGITFGIPILLLLILAIFYTIKEKQAEYDELDEDFASKTEGNSDSDNK